jgi:hypothetical protein
MLIRGGKVNFVPEILNFYRRHEATVTHRSVRDETQAQESLYVKARIFETYPVTPRGIISSLARSVLEYVQLTERMNLKRPSFAANAHLWAVLCRIRKELETRLNDSAALRVVLVLGDLEATAETLAMIELANALAREHTVFVCNAQPSLCDEVASSRLDARVIPVEGTLGLAPWTAEDDLDGAGSPDPRRRAVVLRELLRILRIDVVHSLALPADQLMFEALEECAIPWITHRESLETGKTGALTAASCTEAYLEFCNSLAFPRTREPNVSYEAENVAVSRRRPA